ncbi:hyalin-like [Amphiura filiformis]|uniref:hyalin-like n=1 Tax=Amphiura filiformis TaxID=82378 RepID=UPI003B215204
MMFTTVSWKPPNVTGGEGLIKVITNYSPEDQFPASSTRVIYDVVYGDDNDVVTSCYFDVNVYAISLVCPRDILFSAEPARDSAHVYWDPARVVGNSEYISISSTHNPGDDFQIGLTIVAYEARSVFDNETVTNCRFGVSVLDIEIPTISCPADILIYTDASTEPYVTWESVNATDNSGYVTINCSHISGAVFSVGLHEVICATWDPYGNQNKCFFMVHIEGVEIKCPENISTVIDKGFTMATVTWDHPDVIGGTNKTSLTVNEIPGDMFPVGPTVVEYMVYDPDSQLITSCNFTIAVYDPDIPTLFCPDNAYELTEKNKPKQVVWDLPEIFDFSGTATLTYQSHMSGIVFYEGLTTIEYAATDFMGKIGHCTFTVEVIGVQINCPKNVHTLTDFRSAYANITWYAPEVIGGEGYEKVNTSGELWQEFPIGHSLITYDVSDRDGTVVTNCTFEVKVEDKEPPVIICPADVVAPVQLRSSDSVHWSMPYVKDNSGVITAITSSYKSGDIFQIGSTNVTYNIEDGFGNINECSFNVIVQEVSMYCPSDVNVTTSNGLSFAANVTWSHPIIHGYTGQLDLLPTRPLGDSFGIGNHVVTYTASKGSKIITECNFSVSVHDIENPVIICPEDILVLVEPNNTPSVTWSTPYVNDNSGVISSVISSLKPGDRIQVGSTGVKYTVEDGSGNIDSCMFRVVVKEVTIECPADFSVTTDLGSAYANNVTWPEPYIQGYEGQLQITSNRPLHSSFSIGEHILIWMASKGSVFSTKCNFTLFVYDTEPPSIKCPEDISITVYTGNTSTPVRWESAVATDNSGQDVRMIGSHSSDDRFHVGSTIVTYSAIDTSGVTATCDFNITVIALCSKDVSFVDNIGVLTWHASEIGSVAKSSKTCPIYSSNRHEAIATRQCASHEHLGAAWNDPKLSDCGDKVELNLDKLADVPVELSNVVEVAVALDNLTTDIHSITSNDLVNIQITMRNIVEEEATLPQIALALVNTTNHILTSNHLRPCPGNNRTLMSTEALLTIINSVDHQMAVSSQEFVVKVGDVAFTRNIIDTDTPGDDSVFMKTQISKDTYAYVHIERKETCFKQLGKNASAKAILTAYGGNTRQQITTSSLMRGKLVIVSPLVSMVLADYECGKITVEIPYNITHVNDARILEGKEVKCAVLTDGDNDGKSTTNICKTVTVAEKSITCECNSIGVFVAVTEYECWSKITWSSYTKVAFYIAIGGICISIILLLISVIITKRKLPTYQTIMCFFWASLICLYVSFLALDHVSSLPFGCVAFKACVQYFAIAALLWSAIEAQAIYLLIRNTDENNRFSIPISCLLACFVPLVPVGLALWLGLIDELNKDERCMITLDMISYFTLILPACLIVFHNTLLYLVIGYRLVPSRRLFFTEKRLSLAFTETLCLFIMVVAVMTSAYGFLITRAAIYEIALSVSLVILTVVIISTSCIRLARYVRKSGTYVVHQDQNGNKDDVTVKPKSAVYFSPFTDGLASDDKTRESTCLLGNGGNMSKNEKTTNGAADDNGNLVANDVGADMEYFCPVTDGLELTDVKLAQEAAILRNNNIQNEN